LGVGAGPAACFADEPVQPATTSVAQPAAQQTPAASSASTDPASKAPVKETATAAGGKDSDADEKRLLARGYKKEIRNGQTMYCRKEIKTGSHFETKQCGTAESMALAEQQARDLMQNSQYSSGAKVN
jgi:hypothetical protein